MVILLWKRNALGNILIRQYFRGCHQGHDESIFLAVLWRKAACSIVCTALWRWIHQWCGNVGTDRCAACIHGETFGPYKRCCQPMGMQMTRHYSPVGIWAAYLRRRSPLLSIFCRHPTDRSNGKEEEEENEHKQKFTSRNWSRLNASMRQSPWRVWFDTIRSSNQVMRLVDLLQSVVLVPPQCSRCYRWLHMQSP